MTKQQSIQWVSPNKSEPIKAKVGLSLNKVMAKGFLNASGIIHIYFQIRKKSMANSTTINWPGSTTIWSLFGQEQSALPLRESKDDWKRALIPPIHKKGQKNDVKTQSYIFSLSKIENPPTMPTMKSSHHQTLFFEEVHKCDHMEGVKKLEDLCTNLWSSKETT